MIRFCGMDDAKPGLNFVFDYHHGATNYRLEEKDTGAEIELSVICEGGRKRFEGVELIIDVPTPFRKRFDLDFGRLHRVLRANAWLRIALCRGGYSGIWWGIRPRYPKNERKGTA